MSEKSKYFYEPSSASATTDSQACGEESQAERDNKFMLMAINEAHRALKLQEVPIGAVVVCAGKIIGRGHNLVETLCDATAHAEMQSITAAATTLGGKYLKGCTLYVTVEPCVMCAGALAWSQIDRVVPTLSVDILAFKVRFSTPRLRLLEEFWPRSASS